jgi:hypothetical protein
MQVVGESSHERQLNLLLHVLKPRVHNGGWECHSDEGGNAVGKPLVVLHTMHAMSALMWFTVLEESDHEKFPNKNSIVYNTVEHIWAGFFKRDFGLSGTDYFAFLSYIYTNREN